MGVQMGENCKKKRIFARAYRRIVRTEKPRFFGGLGKLLFLMMFLAGFSKYQ